MKLFTNGAFCAILSLSVYCGSAQQTLPITEPDYNKPKLFAALNQSLNVNLQSLESLLLLSQGALVNIPLGSSLYKGLVMSKSDPSDKYVQSIVIKSTNYIGAAFTFTKIIKGDGTFLYRGRVISREHSDAFELVMQNGQYMLTKKHQLKLLNE